jgi:ubiquinone/menaquinone biosynthesis C-methylase UbiE
MESHGRSNDDQDVQKLTQFHLSFAPSRVLTTALQLRVFSHLAAGKATAAAVASAAGASERGTRMLLDALVALDLLGKKDGRYTLTPLAERYLVRESPDYAGYIMESDALWEAWSHLAECVRTGKPCHAVNQPQGAEEFFPVLVRGLHITNRGPARSLARALGAGDGHGKMRVLDVACGSGVWGIAVAEANPEARVTAQDFPKVLELTRQFLRQHGVEDRYDFLPGDLKQADLGESRYDLALLGNIVHSEGEHSSRHLFKRLHGALKPGGRVAVLDMIPNDDRTGSPFPILFALNMLVNTDEGDTYTLAEYTGWLQDAGFGRIETADIGSHSPAIIATKG